MNFSEQLVDLLKKSAKIIEKEGKKPKNSVVGRKIFFATGEDFFVADKISQFYNVRTILFATEVFLGDLFDAGFYGVPFSDRDKRYLVPKIVFAIESFRWLLSSKANGSSLQAHSVNYSLRSAMKYLIDYFGDAEIDGKRFIDILEEKGIMELIEKFDVNLEIAKKRSNSGVVDVTLYKKKYMPKEHHWWF